MQKNIKNRKLRKLVSSPKAFFIDAMKNREARKVKENKISIVSAVYNVDKYIEVFIKSVVKQTYSEKNIELILVDDGSVDNTKAIIDRWKSKYPNTIKYIYQDNSGQASARNKGIENAEGNWVSFIDPDDFINKDYFKEINKCINLNNETIKMICCKMVVFDEVKNQYSDTQSLKYCFNEEISLVNTDDLGDKIQLSASSAVFDLRVIKSLGLKFNKDIKPNFEDGKFILDYLRETVGKVAFLNKSKYFYRTRGDGSSTSDTQWLKKEKYSTVLEYGILKMLMEYANRYGKVPRHAQRTALYFLSQYFNRLVNDKNIIPDFCYNDKIKFRKLISKCFTYIDTKEIVRFNLNGCRFYHKLGMQAIFKGEDKFTFQMAYISDLDCDNKELEVTYYCFEPEVETCEIDGNKVMPVSTKNIKHKFIDKCFFERRLWYKFDDFNHVFSLKLGKDTIISIGGETYGNSIGIFEIRDKLCCEQEVSNLKYKNSWLFMDLPERADDNAEHLYRYIINNTDEKAFFVINKNSQDWSRLENEGFRLLDFKSKDFHDAYYASKLLLSSHINKYFTEMHGSKYFEGKKFIFLQHGITKDDLSSWINNTTRISGMVTATEKESGSIFGEESSYYLTKHEEILSGFPRHDALFDIGIRSKKSKKILIMPTWRQSLTGNFISGQTVRDVNSNFSKSEYYIQWQKFFISKKVKNIAFENGYELIVILHPNLEGYIEEFNILNCFTVRKCSDISFREVIAESDFLITDYSSVAFDFAFLRKPSIYFQFDEDTFFNGSHSYRKGYFSYRENGFGPVVNDVNGLEKQLSIFIKNSSITKGVYKENISLTFKYFDGNNSKRAYEGVKRVLNNSRELSFSSYIEILDACLHKKDSEATDWVLENIPDKYKIDFIPYQQKYAIYSNVLKGKIISALSIFDSNLELKMNDETRSHYTYCLLVSEDWDLLMDFYSNVRNVYISDVIIMIMIKLNRNDFVLNCQLEVLIRDIDESSPEFFKIFNLLHCGKLSNCAIHLLNIVGSTSVSLKKEFWIELVCAQVCISLGDFKNANKLLNDFELHTRNNILCRKIISDFYFSKKVFSKSICQLESAFDGLDEMPINIVDKYLRSIIAYKEEAINKIELSICNKSSLPIVMSRSLLLKGQINAARKIFIQQYCSIQRRTWDNNAIKHDILIDLYSCEWLSALKKINLIRRKDDDDYINVFVCLLALKNKSQALKVFNGLSKKNNLNEATVSFAYIIVIFLSGDISKACSELETLIECESEYSIVKYGYFIILAYVYLNIGNFPKVYESLNKHELLKFGDIRCRFLIAKVAFAQKNYKKVIRQTRLAYPLVNDIPKLMLLNYYHSLIAEGEWDEANTALSCLKTFDFSGFNFSNESFIKMLVV